MGARRYSASTGRFLQYDLYHNALDNYGLSEDPLTQNRYALAGANPVNFVEIDGHVAGGSQHLLESGGSGDCVQELYRCHYPGQGEITLSEAIDIGIVVLGGAVGGTAARVVAVVARPLVRGTARIVVRAAVRSAKGVERQARVTGKAAAKALTKLAQAVRAAPTKAETLVVDVRAASQKASIEINRRFGHQVQALADCLLELASTLSASGSVAVNVAKATLKCGEVALNSLRR